MRTFLLLALLLIALLGGAAFLLGQDDAPLDASLALAEAMGSDTTGYARAEAPRPFIFPDDHGPHPDFKTEWWYYTGNLTAAAGRPFGYELTIFRIALAPTDSAAAGPSAWATNQLYMAHFALTDVAGEAFYDFERFSRGAAGLAGAQAEPFRVWLEDWTLTGGDPFPLRLRTGEDGVAVDLVMRPAKPLVLQGEDGLDQKGPGTGNASFYYSYTRLTTEGTVTVGGETFDVKGLSWMDREWSTSALGEEQVGWDWFALQLSNGYDLMFYQLRERGGGTSPYSDGVLVGPGGQPRKLARDEVLLDVLETWESPTGAVYPAKWRLRVPGEALDLTITPFIPNQELDASVRYWEGAVRFEGTMAGRPVEGTGYVEMTGYGDNAAQRIS